MIDPAKAFVIIATIYLLGFFGHAFYLKKTVYGDGIFYYSWLRSIMIDKDIDFTNEYAHFHVQQPKTIQHLPENKYAVGPALLWFPLFMWTHSIMKSDGYALWYQLVAGMTSVFFTITGLILLFRLLNKYFSQTTSILAIIAIAFATNLFFYGSLDTVNSHSLSFFAACLYLTFLFSKHKNYILIGASLGLLGIIRTHDLVYGLLFLPLMYSDILIPGIRRRLIAFTIGLLLIFFPQLLAWEELYGKFWINPYLAGGEGFTLTHPHILAVLFSPHNGLFLWTPILLLGLAGLLKSSVIPAKAGIYRMFLLVILLQIWIVASWSTWWQGASYGGRMFVSILPLFAFGIADIFRLLKIYGWKLNYFLLTIIGPLSMLNALFIFFFLLRT